MDELITEQIMESNITTRKTEYSDVIHFISERMENDEELKTWFLIPNNIIGFSAAMPKAFDDIRNAPPQQFKNSILNFEEAFSSINVSKIRLGMARRKMVKYFLENYDKLSILDANRLLDIISMEL